MSNDIIIYHKDCVDGFTAAWIADRVLYGNPIMHPAQYGDEPPWSLLTDKTNLFILDFSYPRDMLLSIQGKVKNIKVLDHHKTAEADLVGLDFCEFDMTRSGAGLAWDFFHHGDHRPWIVDYVEDRDLWQWKLNNSKAVNAYIGTVTKTLNDWDVLSAQLLKSVCRNGEAILAYINQYVDEVCESLAREVEFESYAAILINAPFKGISEVLNHLTEKYLVAIGWWQRKDGQFQYGLRSPKDGPDVSEIAKKYGGGGHQHASGFVLDRFIF